jgi:hypothetical protein
MFINFPIIPFGFCLFLSAFLLFVIQPMAAKVLLPLFGGAPMVWTVCMLYFQIVLLLAYGYAFLLSRYLPLKGQQLIHCIILVASFLMLPILWETLPDSTSIAPTVSLLSLLFLKLTIPLWMISATAPLLQFWFSKTHHPSAHDPYFLYVASNFGSFLALLGYPFIIERFIGLKEQSFVWSIGYIIFALIIGLLCLLINYKPAGRVYQKHESIRLQCRIRWIYLSFVPVSLMLGVTTYITTDIASTPLLWVLPLALYLLSFVITFSHPPLLSHQWVINNVVFVLAFPLLGFVFGSRVEAFIELIVVHLATFFMLAMLCHGELVKSRPSPHHLTEFYLIIALGGVLAGVFNSLIAPYIFSQAYEYPLAIIFAVLILPSQVKTINWKVILLIGLLLCVNYFLPSSFVWMKKNHIIPVLCVIIMVLRAENSKQFALSLVLLFLFVFVISDKKVLWQGRNFFGIKRVVQQDNAHMLISQTTIHGVQLIDKDIKANQKLAYYQPSLEVGRMYDDAQLQVAIVGLGVGIIGCQFDKKDTVHFYEIDPQIITIAKENAFFTLVKDCQPKALFKLGDARLSLQKEKNNYFDLIILDAFNSDAIPTHLLTYEALLLYQGKLKKDGALLIHISNRYLNLLPVIAAFTQNLKLPLLFKHSKSQGPWQFASEWVLITKNKHLIDKLVLKDWFKVIRTPDFLWTDDYSNIIPLLK